MQHEFDAEQAERAAQEAADAAELQRNIEADFEWREQQEAAHNEQQEFMDNYQDELLRSGFQPVQAPNAPAGTGASGFSAPPGTIPAIFRSLI
jgi:hypothetical protein